MQTDAPGDDGKSWTVEAQSVDAMLAARELSDRLVEKLGGKPANAFNSSRPSTTELFQRVEAALLVDDIETARGLIESAPDSLRALPEAKLDMARIEFGADHFEAARTKFESLLASTPSETDPILRARVLTGLGTTLLELNELQAAEGRLADAIALLEGGNEPSYLGKAYNARGYTHFLEAQPDEARADYANARLAYDIARDALALARVDNNEALLDIQNDHPAEALPLLERAADRLASFGLVESRATILINQFNVYLLLLQPAKALALHETIGATFDRLQSSTTLHMLELARAEALAANGHFRDAERRFDDVAHRADPATEDRMLGWIDGLRAEVYLQRGDSQLAVAAARRAVESWALAKYPHECSADWPVLIRALRRTGGTEAATELDRYATCANASGDRHTALVASLLSAEAAWAANDRVKATSLYEDTLRTAQQRGVPKGIADVAVSYGNALLDAGEVASATRVVGYVMRWSETDYRCALLTARLYQALGRREPWKAALERARTLAAEREVPTELTSFPAGQRLATAPP